MRATTIHGTRDIRVSEVPDPTIEAPTDAIVKVVAGCICGSDLWPYRGENPITPGDTIGHECVGVVEEVGGGVRGFRPGDFVIVPFCHCDNTCAHCAAGVQSACVNGGFTSSGQGEYARVTQADGSLVKTHGMPDDALLPSLLALSDGLLPCTLNSEVPDPACGPQIRFDNARADIRHAMNNSFGFGGNNCSLVFGRVE